MFAKCLFILLVCVSLGSCRPYRSIDTGANPYFTVLSATQEKWRSPLPGGGGGSEYFFRTRIDTDQPLTFDSAWIGNYSYPLFIIKQSGTLSNGPVRYSKGDTIILRISAPANALPPPAHAPVSYEGDALTGYKVNDQQKYFIIKKITVAVTPPRQ